MSLSRLMPVLGLLMMIAAPVMAEERKEAEERCRLFAKEDEVPANEMAAYMKQCVEELMAPVEEDAAPVTPAPKS